MRALLGILILGGMFLAAAAWQRGHTEALRAQRRAKFGLPEDPAGMRAADDSWSLLVLGRPSGAPPLPLPVERDREQVEALAGILDPTAGEAESSALTPDASYAVQPGDVLGVVCQKHYGTAKPSLVQAVARYNGLASPDAIRAGDVLLLPDRLLFGR